MTGKTIWLALLSLLHSCYPDAQPKEMTVFDLYLNWIQEISIIPESRFRPVASLDEAGEQPAADSRFWARTIFTPLTDESALAPEAVAAGGPDIHLIRHHFLLPAPELRDVTVFEGRNFFILKKPATGSTQPPGPELPAAITGAFISTEGTPALSWKRVPGGAAGHPAFTTNPAAGISDINSWKARMDAVIIDGNLYVVIYKKESQKIGFADDYDWIKEHR